MLKLDQHQTPYFDAVLSSATAQPVAFHTPGHNAGRAMHPLLRDILGPKTLAMDQIRGLEDLLAPENPIHQAYALAAQAYGADRSYFLINGSSVGNQAMLMTALEPRDLVLVARNSHKSATSALIMSGAKPYYVHPEIDRRLRIDHCVTPQAVRQALDAHPKAKAVFITSPTYYGAAADLVAIEGIVHERGKLLLVDEAWGSHLHFHPELPPSATSAGADMCVNSTHKLVTGLCQSSMLHTRGDRIDQARLQSVLRLLQSTSPSLILLASLDVARMQMATQGKSMLDGALALARQARARLNRINGIHCIGSELVGRDGVAAYDETRLVITVEGLGYSGYQAEEILRTRFNIQTELADLLNVIALVTIGNRQEDVDRLVDAFTQLAAQRHTSNGRSTNGAAKRKRPRPRALPPVPEQVATPREAFLAEHVEIPFSKSAGRICAEVVTPYPPGIPVLCPGEKITPEAIDYLRLELDAGVHLQGPADAKLRTIRVLHEPTSKR
jgi:arginine decarboxylase